MVERLEVASLQLDEEVLRQVIGFEVSAFRDAMADQSRVSVIENWKRRRLALNELVHQLDIGQVLRTGASLPPLTHACCAPAVPSTSMIPIIIRVRLHCHAAEAHVRNRPVETKKLPDRW